MLERKKIAMLVAEFLGTGVLTLAILTVQHSTIGIPYFVALAAGFTVAALSFVFASASGAHFNPAITLGLWSIRKIKTLPALSYVVVQLLGGWAAYGVFSYLMNTGYKAISQTLQPADGHFLARILIAEAIGAGIFAVVWAAVAAQKLSAAVVGIGLTLGMLVAAAATVTIDPTQGIVKSLGIINPAVALGTRAWTIGLSGSVGWATYALGPIIGGVSGFILYQLVFGEGPAAFKMTPATVAVKSSSAKAVTKKTTAKKRK